MMKLDERDWKDFAVPEIFQNNFRISSEEND